MKCPQCNHEKSFIRDSRPLDHHILRRRECDNCSWKFSTTESLQETITGRRTEETVAAKELGIDVTTLRKLKNILKTIAYDIGAKNAKRKP